MTSKLKCPICGGDIRYNDSYSTYDCKNNPAEHHASEEVWQALTQAKQDLIIAKSTLDWLGYEFPPAYPEKNVIAEMRQKARNAVKYIEHKE